MARTYAHMCAAALACSIMNCDVRDQSIKTQEATSGLLGTQDAERIVYTIGLEKQIPNGGYTRRIAVAPTDRTEERLRRLGDQLRRETSADRNAIVLIFDDRKVARLQDAYTVLTPELQKQWDRHFVAMYARNGNTGHHSLQIFLDGFKGTRQPVTINY